MWSLRSSIAPSMLLLFTGCDPCAPLPDVPIRGGAEREVNAIVSELSLLDRTLAMPVCLRRVKVARDLKEARGIYFRDGRLVHLEGGHMLDLMRETLRHEVCHAVDDQNSLVTGRELLFPYPDPPSLHEGAFRANEAFAELCKVGPYALAALWEQECPSDPGLEGALFVRAEVYGASDPDPAARYEPVASRTLSASVVPATRVTIEPFDDASLRITVKGEREEVRLDVDAATGVDVDIQGAGLDSEALAAPAEAPARWSPGILYRLDQEISLVRASLPVMEQSVLRVHARVGDGWRPVEGPCRPDTFRFFSFDSELWSAQVDGDVLSWGRWIAADGAE